MKLNSTRLVGFALLILAVLPVGAQHTDASTNKLFSEELNAEIPKWISFGGEYRSRVEGFTGGGFKVNNEDTYLLSRCA